ncbi:MAG: hypothetical protein KDD35_01765 [Bdellovibrionales bacterium]|nr:hypothetical protein [Bdellovibrionales bacterium]
MKKLAIITSLALLIQVAGNPASAADEKPTTETKLSCPGLLISTTLQASAQRDQKKAENTEPEPYYQFDFVTRKEVVVGRQVTTNNDPSLETHETLELDVTEGPVAETFLNLFTWQAYTQRPNAEKITRIKISEGIPVDESLRGAVRVESKNIISSYGDDTVGKPGYQNVEIQLKLNGQKLAQLMKSVEAHHLARKGLTPDGLRDYGEQYRKLYYAAYRGYPRGMWEQAEFKKFINAHPLQTRAIDIQVRRAGVRKGDFVLSSYDHSPIGVMDHPEQRPPAFKTFTPEDNQIYEVTLTGGPDILPIVWRGNTGTHPMNNYSTNRYLLMEFFLERVLPLNR